MEKRGRPFGQPYLVPLSFDWDGESLLIATPGDSPTGRNLAGSRTVRLGLGVTRDVTMIDGDVAVLEIDALPPDRARPLRGADRIRPPEETTAYRWFRMTPRRIQAWREADELADRPPHHRGCAGPGSSRPSCNAMDHL